MKASRRQHLRTNQLAQSLTETIQFVQQNSGAVLAGAAATMVVIGLGLYWYNLRSTRYQQGWEDFYGAQLTPAPDARMAKLKEVATRYEDPALVSAALLTLGDACLQEAMSTTRTPEEQQRFRNQAIETFQTIVQAAPNQKLAVASATFKLASLYESQRQWDQAARHYQTLVDDPKFETLPQRALATQALNRLEKLQEPIVYAPAKKPTATAAATRPSKAAGTMASVKDAAGKAIQAAVPTTQKPVAPKKPKKASPTPTKPSKP